MSAEKKKEVRGRKTNLVDQPQRRLDALASLLAAQSICTSVAFINGRFHVTANELHKGSADTNQNITAIEDIYQYFQNLAQGKQVTQDEREEVFKNIICSTKRITSLTQKMVIPEDLCEEAAVNIINHAAPEQQISLYKAMYDKRPTAGAYGLAYGEYVELYTNLKKFETSIKKALPPSPLSFSSNSSNSSSSSSSSSSISGSSSSSSSSSSSGSLPTQEQEVKALSPEKLAGLKKNVHILKNEPNQDVHAELQMLSHIMTNVVADIIKQQEDNKKSKQDKKQSAPTKITEIYIGISKLCCLNCRCMLNAANEVFQNQGIPVHINFQGHHDLNFGRWNCPEIFSNGFKTGFIDTAGADRFSKISYEIGKIGKKKIDQLERLPKPSGVNMGGSGSQSDTESVSDMPRTDKLAELKNHKSFLESFITQKKQPQVNSILGKISVAIQLHDLPEFKSLLLSDLDETVDFEFDEEETLLSILGSYNDKNQPKIDLNYLLEILKNSKLVGEKVAQNFTTLELGSLNSSTTSSSNFSYSKNELSLEAFPSFVSSNSSSSSSSSSSNSSSSLLPGYNNFGTFGLSGSNQSSSLLSPASGNISSSLDYDSTSSSSMGPSAKRQKTEENR
jgi:OTT_1508-like deaminase